MSCMDSEPSMPELASQSDGSVDSSTVQNVFDWFTNAFLNSKFKFLNVLGSVLFLWTAWMKQNLMTRGCLGWPIQVRRTCMSDNSSLGDGDSSDWVIESVDTGLIINGPSISPSPGFHFLISYSQAPLSASLARKWLAWDLQLKCLHISC